MIPVRAGRVKNTKSAMANRARLTPKTKQVDFTDARWAPVINCVLKYGNKILVVRRSKTLNFYPGYWNGISGFLDDNKSFYQKVLAEIKEETGIPERQIKKIRPGEIFHKEEKKYKKTWIIHPVLIEVATDKIKLDWEATDHKWVTLKEAKKLKLLPGFGSVLRNLSQWISK